MKLLLVVPCKEIAQGLITHFDAEVSVPAELLFLQQAKLLHHEVDVLIAPGFALPLVYQLAKVLAKQKYHLAVKLSFASAYSATTAFGTTLNVLNEKPGDAGEYEDSSWKDVYDLHWLNREETPHVRGGFVNMTNAYMNIFMPFKKVVGLTVNRQAETAEILFRKEHYKAEVETSDGLAFVYTCLAEKQTYYHLAVVNRNLAIDAKQENVNEAALHLLIDLIQKL
jgi:hypothetical protein